MGNIAKKIVDGTIAMDRGVMKVASNNPIARGVDKLENKAMSSFAKGLYTKTEKTDKNLWTGYQVSNKAKIGAGIVGVGVIGGSIGHQTYAPIDKTNVTEYKGMPTAMDADGVGTDSNVTQQRYNKMKANNMNADGSLVFGLHNMR